jgi:hypothetical protein
MPLSAGPYFFTVFGGSNTKIPRAISPVAGYVAPDALSSWTALGIHGYVLRYNEFLDQINKYIDGAYSAARSLESRWSSETEKMLHDILSHCVDSGIDECKKYVEYLAASQESVVTGCAQLKIPLPKHGSTAGMKPVYTMGMIIPPGSWAAT